MIENIPASYDSSQNQELSRRHIEMAESIARHTAENNMPLEQVASQWGIQKGIKFVDLLLETPSYSQLSEKEKTAVRNAAAKAISEHWLEAQGFTAYPEVRHDRRYPFWNAGYEL